MQLEQNACGNTMHTVSISWPKVNSHPAPPNQKLHVHTHIPPQKYSSFATWAVKWIWWRMNGYVAGMGALPKHRQNGTFGGVCVCVCVCVFPSQHLRRFLFWIGPAGLGSGKKLSFDSKWEEGPRRGMWGRQGQKERTARNVMPEQLKSFGTLNPPGKIRIKHS